MTTPLTTIASVKAFLGVTDTNATRDALLAELITQCSAIIENYCQRVFALATYTEYRDGTSADTLLLKQAPIVSVTSLQVDAQVLAPAADMVTAGYRVFEDCVVLNLGGQFTRGRRNVKAVYTAGYATVPDDVKQVTNKLIADTYKNRDSVGVSSKSLGPESIAFIKAEMGKPENKAVLNNYRRVVPL